MADYRVLKMALLADTSKFTTGLNKAEKETKSFSGKMKSSAMAIGKSFAVAGVAIAGMAAKLAVDGVKAAIADQKSQVMLAKTLQNTTHASDKQTKAVENYIDKLQRATGVADDKLRPSLAKLLTATGSITKAQKLQGLAMDISAGTGKDLETVSLALAKAYSGNLGSLTRLGIKLDDTIIKNKDFDAAAKELNKTFGGQSAAAAATMEGKIQRLNIAFEEAKEQIGYALLPVIEDFVGYLTSPEGQKAVTDFAEAFANAMKSIAQVLPGIVQNMSKLVKNVSKYGLAQGLMMDPQIQAAALAYGAALIYTGPQGAAIAALAAYAAAGSFMSSADAGSKGYKKKAIAQSTIKIPGVSETNADVVENTRRVYGGLTSNLNGNRPSTYRGVAGVAPVNITINALSPAEAARAVIAAQNKAARMGVSRLSGAAG